MNKLNYSIGFHCVNIISQNYGKFVIGHKMETASGAI